MIECGPVSQVKWLRLSDTQQGRKEIQNRHTHHSEHGSGWKNYLNCCCDSSTAPARAHLVRSQTLAIRGKGVQLRIARHAGAVDQPRQRRHDSVVHACGAQFALQLPQRLRRKRGNVETVQRKQWRYQPTAAPSQSSQSDCLQWYAAVHGIRVWGLSTKTLNSPRPPYLELRSTALDALCSRIF